MEIMSSVMDWTSEFSPNSDIGQSGPQSNLSNYDSELLATTTDNILDDFVFLPENTPLNDSSNFLSVNTSPNIAVDPIDTSCQVEYLSTFLNASLFSSLSSPSSSLSPLTPDLSCTSSGSNTMDQTLLSPLKLIPETFNGPLLANDNFCLSDYNLNPIQFKLESTPLIDEEMQSELQLSQSVRPWVGGIQPSPMQLQSQYATQNRNYPNTQHISQLQDSNQQLQMIEEQRVKNELMVYQERQRTHILPKLQMLQQIQQYQQSQTHVQSQSLTPPQLQLENQQQQQIKQHEQSQALQPPMLSKQQQGQLAFTNQMDSNILNVPPFALSSLPSVLEPYQSTARMSPPPSQEIVLPIVPESILTMRDNKRLRTSITLEGKVEIINYKKQNPSVSVQELSKKIGVPRSTIYGIFENSEKIISLSRNQPNMSRVVENRFRILEVLLLDWNLNLESRGIRVTNRKLCAQAFEIHRMLSGLLKDPLPQCLFTTGWLKGFKERRAAHFAIASSTQERSQSDKVKDMLGKLHAFSEDDIYTCDVTSMYLEMMPKSVYKDVYQGRLSHRTDSSSISTLLCCNASGKDMLEPVVLVRQTSNVVGLQGYNGVVLDSDLNDVTSRVVWSWLMGFDNNVERSVVLLVDQAMYDLFELEKVSGKNLLRFVTVLCVPRSVASFLPMSARIVRDFKAYYYTLLLKDTQEWLRHSGSRRAASDTSRSYMGQSFMKSSQYGDVCPLNTIVSQLRVIPNAWLHVSASAIESDFQYFLKVAEDLASGDQPRSSSPSEDAIPPEGTLKEMLMTVYPNLPSSVTQYYLTQSNEIGPSCFLRTQILAMRNHEDFTGCFGDTLNFGTVQFASRKLQTGGRFENVQQKRIAHQESELLENYKRLTSSFGELPRHTREESPLVVTFGPMRASTY